MTLLEAIDLRRSRRKYRDTPIAPDIAERLQELARRYSEAGDIRIELVFEDGAAFDGLRRSYGMFSGVRSYAGLIAPKDDLAAAQRLGYYGELLMLHAVAMGLGACWVGGSFDRKRCPFALRGDETVVCVITLGYVPERLGGMERFLYGVTHRKSKSIEEMMQIISQASGTEHSEATCSPQAFLDGMQAVQKAPSAVNRQPVEFTYEDGKVTARVEKKDAMTAVDLGIAKAHFALGAGQGTWEWGNGGAFAIDS